MEENWKMQHLLLLESLEVEAYLKRASKPWSVSDNSSVTQKGVGRMGLIVRPMVHISSMLSVRGRVFWWWRK